MKKIWLGLFAFLVISCLLFTSCQTTTPEQSGKKNIVVTYSVLGSLVKELVDDQAEVTVLIPNGQDMHDWEPSARDIESINKADYLIQNGLELETGILDNIQAAAAKGTKVFTASDYIEVRYIQEGEFAEEHEHGEAEAEEEGEEEHHNHEIGAADPHLWTDPVGMKSIINALAEALQQDLDIDVKSNAADLVTRMDNLDREIVGMISEIPADNLKLVTGHNSMGYYAREYGFQVIGAIIPSISTQAGVSASDLAELKELIEANNVTAVFTELGTNAEVAETIGKETGVQVIEISTHLLPEDGSYFTMMREMTRKIVDGLK